MQGIALEKIMIDISSVNIPMKCLVIATADLAHSNAKLCSNLIKLTDLVVFESIAPVGVCLVSWPF